MLYRNINLRSVRKTILQYFTFVCRFLITLLNIMYSYSLCHFFSICKKILNLWLFLIPPGQLRWRLSCERHWERRIQLPFRKALQQRMTEQISIFPSQNFDSHCKRKYTSFVPFSHLPISIENIFYTTNFTCRNVTLQQQQCSILSSTSPRYMPQSVVL